MSYFRITQDDKVRNPIKVPLSYQEIISDKPLAKILNFKQIGFDFLPLDYMSIPCPIVSHRLYHLMVLYDLHIHWQSLSLIDQDTRVQYQYWILKKPMQDCLLTFDEDNFVFSSDKLGDESVIRVKIHSDLPRNEFVVMSRLANEIILVRLDLAESILRRNFYGIKLIRIHVK